MKSLCPNNSLIMTNTSNLSEAKEDLNKINEPKLNTNSNTLNSVELVFGDNLNKELRILFIALNESLEERYASENNNFKITEIKNIVQQVINIVETIGNNAQLHNDLKTIEPYSREFYEWCDEIYDLIPKLFVKKSFLKQQNKLSPAQQFQNRINNRVIKNKLTTVNQEIMQQKIKQNTQLFKGNNLDKRINNIKNDIANENKIQGLCNKISMHSRSFYERSNNNLNKQKKLTEDKLKGYLEKYNREIDLEIQDLTIELGNIHNLEQQRIEYEGIACDLNQKVMKLENELPNLFNEKKEKDEECRRIVRECNEQKNILTEEIKKITEEIEREKKRIDSLSY